MLSLVKRKNEHPEIYEKNQSYTLPTWNAIN